MHTHTSSPVLSFTHWAYTQKSSGSKKKKRKVFTLLYWLSPPSDRIVPELVFRWGASSSAKGTFLQQVNNTCQQCNNACELCCSHSYLSTVLQQVNVQNPSVNPSSISPFLLFPITSSILQQVIHTSKSHLTFANKGGQKKNYTKGHHGLPNDDKRCTKNGTLCHFKWAGYTVYKMKDTEKLSLAQYWWRIFTSKHA